MLLPLKKRLDLLKETNEKVSKGVIRFDPKLANFGFRKMEQLFPVYPDEIKGYPCLAYSKFSDHIKFGVKVIPLENKYEPETHPSRIESRFLKEFRQLILDDITPHITFYYTDFDVSNKNKALTRFPLKYLRKDIYKTSNVLVTEFVPGGSIEEWVQENDVLEKQWKYIIFSMVWTLFVLQHKYKFMHNDFHYGNILVDTCIDPKDRTVIVYDLECENGEKKTFYCRNVGVIPKIFDTEFSDIFQGMEGTYKNMFGRKEDCIPQEYNPYYDLHYFLITLLELNISDSIRDFILSVYPPELIPERDDSSSSEDSSNSSRSSSSSASKCSTCGKSLVSDDSLGSMYNEYFYETDEETVPSVGGSNKSKGSDSDTDMSDDSRSTTSSEESEIRTEFLYGERMLNGTENKIPNIATPAQLLDHPFFNEYREKPKKIVKSVKFSYQTLPTNANNV